VGSETSKARPNRLCTHQRKKAVPKSKLVHYLILTLLPDGSYNVSFEGRTMKVKKVAGNWEAGEV